MYFYLCYNYCGDIMNYLLLANKQNKLNEEIIDFKKCYKTKDFENNLDVYVEKKTYINFLRLKNRLLKNNIDIAISSGYRSFERQQEIIDRYTNKYGKEQLNLYVANVGESEHHIGLCIDIVTKFNNKYMLGYEEFDKKEEYYDIIHSLLHKFGFILRYPKDKENITGYNYEPWHIRYVGKKSAKYIYENSLTLEEYLNK